MIGNPSDNFKHLLFAKSPAMQCGTAHNRAKKSITQEQINYTTGNDNA